MKNVHVESTLIEHRRFPPPVDLSTCSHLGSLEQYEELYRHSMESPETFWAEQAGQLHWFKKWHSVLEWNLPDAKWFVGGQINLCHNCVDRFVDQGQGDKTALVWEGEGGDGGEPPVRRFTYRELQREVSVFANVLKSRGVKKGDVVTLYMGMVPELAIATLACARIGAPHSVIFGGFSAQAIVDRVEDAHSRIVITCDGAFRGGKTVALKATVDKALSMTGQVKEVICCKRTGAEVGWNAGRDHWWHELAEGVSDHCPPEPLDSEDLAFLLYTSGSTGKPKGIMHTVGGYLVHANMSARYTFDLQPEDPDELHWCTADIGWITGHSYVLYGILSNGVASVMYEGGPGYPEKDRFWQIIARHRVTKFYTAPTAIRTFMKWGEEHLERHDLSSLKILGTVGEPINPEAWVWYHRHIGGQSCPIVDTWWQTETGGHMLAPMPAAATTTPGSCWRPLPGIDMAVVNSAGDEVGVNEGGILVSRRPWPGMLRGVYGDRQRFIDTYWSQVPGFYTAGDGARRDELGQFWITGRIDDVIVVSGHNIGTMEVESALVSHPVVSEAAVVGFPHEIKGNGLAAFVITKDTKDADVSASVLRQALIEHCGQELGPICRPDSVYFVEALPKTSSGKIMRRILRDVAAGRPVEQDLTTLDDTTTLDGLATAAVLQQA